jgi:hypothetical protein
VNAASRTVSLDLWFIWAPFASFAQVDEWKPQDTVKAGAFPEFLDQKGWQAPCGWPLLF